MTPVDIGTPDHPEFERVEYAKNQPQYLTLPSVRNVNDPMVPVVSVWEPDANELLMLKGMIERGDPVRFSLMQCVCTDDKGQPNPLQPVRLVVGELVPGTISNAGNNNPIVTG